MSGWTTQPRKAANGCFGCRQERGLVAQALSARVDRVATLWPCAGCAASAGRRQAFMDEYVRRAGLAETPHRRPDELSWGEGGLASIARPSGWPNCLFPIRPGTRYTAFAGGAGAER